MIRHGLNACPVLTHVITVVLAPLLALLMTTIRCTALRPTTQLSALRIRMRAAHLAPVAAWAHVDHRAALRALVHPQRFRFHRHLRSSRTCPRTLAVGFVLRAFSPCSWRLPGAL